MNILLFNQDWFAEEFRSLGHHVVTAGTRAHMQVLTPVPGETLAQVIERLPGGVRPDCVIVHDESAPLLISGFEESPVPTIFYSVDAHHHIGVHRYTAHAFDAAFVAQRDYIPQFEAAGASAAWMPLWASRHIEPSNDKRYGAVFVGSMNAALNPERVAFFDRLQKAAPLLVTSGAFWQIFPYAEMVVNQTVKKDLNFRVFEAMMSGALLLTEDAENGLRDLFHPGRHLVTYKKGSVEEAAAQIAYYLDHKSEAREIACSGREEILRAHRPIHRAQFLLNVLDTLKPRKRHWRYYSVVPNFVWAANVLRKGSPALQARGVEIALRYVVKGLASDPPPDEDLACYLVAACLDFDHLLQASLGAKVLERVCEQAAHIPLMHAAKMWMLMRRGEQSGAEKYARDYAATPVDQTLEQVRKIMGELLSWSV